MKMITPWTGVEIDVAEPFVERYKAKGYKLADAPKKEKKVEETPVEPVEEVADEPKPKKSKK